MRWHKKKYQDENYTNVKVSRTKKTSLKLNIAETVLQDLEEFQEKSDQVWYVDNNNHKCRCNDIVLFQVLGAKPNLKHFQVNETGRTMFFLCLKWNVPGVLSRLNKANTSNWKPGLNRR